MINATCEEINEDEGDGFFRDSSAFESRKGNNVHLHVTRNTASSTFQRTTDSPFYLGPVESKDSTTKDSSDAVALVPATILEESMSTLQVRDSNLSGKADLIPEETPVGVDLEPVLAQHEKLEELEERNRFAPDTMAATLTFRE